MTGCGSHNRDKSVRTRCERTNVNTPRATIPWHERIQDSPGTVFAMGLPWPEKLEQSNSKCSVWRHLRILIA